MSLVVFHALLVAWTAWALTHPPRRTYASALAKNAPGDPSELPDEPRRFTSWKFSSGGVELPVWEIPGDRVDGPVFVLTHGWGSSRIGALSRVPWLLPRASSIIAWDMRGHGESPGVCMQGTREVTDLLELLKQLPRDKAVVLMGWSLGAGVSIAAAAGDARVRGVIAECPYRRLPTPARNMMRTTGMPWRTNLRPALWLLGLGEGTFDRVADATKLACPLLVIHGDADEISPHEDGKAIARAASKGELSTIAGGGHQGLWVDPATQAACGHAVAAWLDRLA